MTEFEQGMTFAVVGGWVLKVCLGLVGVWLFFAAINIVRPTQRGLIERLGKYHRFANPGFHLTIPWVEQMLVVDVTEQMVDATKQQVITNDNLNATVDAQVYFKVRSDEAGVKSSQYQVQSCQRQIVSLARTTLRNILGTMTLKSANSERGKINQALYQTLAEETKSWGIEIVRTELKEIDPPNDVQETMNMIVKAENQKLAAKDFAIATETQADGQRMASIKVAEGLKQASILKAEGEAKAITLVNDAAKATFKGEAVQLRQLEVLEKGLLTAAKVIIVPAGQSLTGMLTALVAEKS